MTKLTLDSVEWKEFKFTDIFTKIQRGKRLTKGDQIEGGIPYVSSTSINNGVDNFISNEENIRKFENCLTLANSGSVGSCFYQQYEFIGSDHVTILENKNFSKEIYLFLSSIIKRLEEKYSFNREINDARIRRETVILPVNSKGSPHWQFMEDYIKQERRKQAIQIRNYYEPKLLMLAGELAGLEEVEWKIFELKELFEFERGNQNNMAKCQQGEVPLISAKKIDNGVKTFIKDNGKKLFKGNILTLNNDGDGGVGIAYYQSSVTALDTHVTALIPKFKANKNLLLFLSQLITMQRDKFSHGYSLNNLRLSKQRIMLPVDTYGNPNWQYMEDYVKRLELEQIENILEYIYRTISFHRDFQKSQSIEWKEFWLEDVCEIKSGKDIYERERIVGKIPYITATASQNGIGYFIGNSNTTLEQGCLSVNRNGSVGYSFYHDYLALFGNDTRKLKLKEQNKYVGLFISRIITNQKEKYGYGYKMGTARLKRQKIMLPVNADGTIAYGYMVDQMKWLEFKEIYKILSAIR